MDTKDNDDVARQALRIATQLDPDPSHAFQVAKTSLVLFDQLCSLHDLGPTERRLLHAAALMHDIGYSVGARKHNKASRDLILAADLPDISVRQRMMVACIARYHNGPVPKPTHKVYRDLAPRERDAVERLAALLRIADGLDRSHSSTLKNISTRQKETCLCIRVKQTPSFPDDIAAAQRKGNLFQTIYGIRLKITAE